MVSWLQHKNSYNRATIATNFNRKTQNIPVKLPEKLTIIQILDKEAQ